MGPRPCSSAFLANTAAEQARSGREYLLPGQLLVGWAMTVVADHESGPQGSPPAAGPGGQGRLRRSDPGAGGIRRRRRGPRLPLPRLQCAGHGSADPRQDQSPGHFARVGGPGRTIAAALGDLGRDSDFGDLATRGRAESAVLRLLAEAG